MIATPRPPRTRGRLVDFAYTRSPGLDTRRRPAMLRSQLGPYFSCTTSDLPTRASSVRKSLMYPSALRISAMFALIFECGRATSSWYAELALRRRVKKSAIGSVIVMTEVSPSSRWFPLSGLPRSSSLLPAALLHAGEFAGMRHFPQADPAQAELAV